jgi:hypothetical protein
MPLGCLKFSNLLHYVQYEAKCFCMTFKALNNPNLANFCKLFCFQFSFVHFSLVTMPLLKHTKFHSVELAFTSSLKHSCINYNMAYTLLFTIKLACCFLLEKPILMNGLTNNPVSQNLTALTS